MTATGRKAKVPDQTLRSLAEEVKQAELTLSEGGGERGRKRQERLGRLVVRDRLRQLLDDPTDFLELGIWAAYGMYEEWGDLPAAGVVTGIGPVCGRQCMIIANDATVKAGAMFPQSIKKTLRAQRIAFQCRLPILYLVDSSGVFLPLQEDIFPDEDDFGRIFRNNSVLSAAGIPQMAAVMGNCIAGGGYLPVLCDKLLMTEGSGLYLAGPALVKAAIGQEVDTEELGGASMHSEISGIVDFHEPDDPSCLKQMRKLVDLLPPDDALSSWTPSPVHHGEPTGQDPQRPIEDVYDLVSANGTSPYDVRDVLNCIVDEGSLLEYKATYGQSLVTAYARVKNQPVGIVANQRKPVQSKKEGLQIGGVIYGDSADKAARFVMECNQSQIPLVFLQDVMGFMVGKEAEQSGIIRRGAKLVSAISNSIVPKITIILGNSFGAGHYALCGKAYDPDFIFAWPNAKYAVMGADQAANVVFSIQKKAAERQGKLDEEALKELHRQVKQRYQEATDIRFAAARGWVDGIIAPHTTRDVLANCLELTHRRPPSPDRFHAGVFQV